MAKIIVEMRRVEIDGTAGETLETMYIERSDIPNTKSADIALSAHMIDLLARRLGPVNGETIH